MILLLCQYLRYAVEPYQGYNSQGNRRVDGVSVPSMTSRMTPRDDEHSAASFGMRRALYEPATYPSTTTVATSNRGAIYPRNFDSDNYAPSLGQRSTTGRIGESGSIAADLNRVKRLEEELKIIKRHMHHSER